MSARKASSQITRVFPLNGRILIRLDTQVEYASPGGILLPVDTALRPIVWKATVVEGGLLPVNERGEAPDTFSTEGDRVLVLDQVKLTGIEVPVGKDRLWLVKETEVLARFDDEEGNDEPLD